MDEVSLFKFGKWIDHGKSLPKGEKLKTPFNISGVDEATLFKFGKWIDYGKSHHRGEKFPLKGAWFGSRDALKNFKLPSIFLEWMKVHCLNLPSGSTAVSPSLGHLLWRFAIQQQSTVPQSGHALLTQVGSMYS